MRRDDVAGASIIGAIIVLAIIATSIVYVNTVHVPRQGVAMEVAASQKAAAALVGIAGKLGDGAYVLADVPLRGERATPPLLSGVILSPARMDGTLGFLPNSSNLTVSVVIDAPAGGVPANDPVRQDLGGGKMRLYLVGNSTGALPMGALRAYVGGAYTSQAQDWVEGGAVVARRSNMSTALAAPALSITRDSTTIARWHLPLLAGTPSEVSGSQVGQVSLTPGPTATIGGGATAYNASIVINTTMVTGWTAAMQDVVGPNGFVNTTRVGADDNGTVDVVILAPAGTAPTTKAVEFVLKLTRFEVALAERHGG